MTNCEDDDTNI